MPCKTPFSALLPLLCLWAVMAGTGVPALAQDSARLEAARLLDGEWRRFGGEERASLDLGAGLVVFDGRKFRVGQMIKAQPQQGPVWLVRSGGHRLRAQLLDGLLLEILLLEEEFVFYLVPEGFRPPQGPPGGVWVGEQEGKISIYDLEAGRLRSGRWNDTDGSFEEAAFWTLVPMGEEGGSRFFHVGLADDPQYYRAIVQFTDNFALLTVVNRNRAGLRPDPDRGVTVLRRKEF